ncbi:DNA-binding IclR family transcriptional regulator [Microbacterium sp. SORGH_AS428]|jgi:DNA-binding IclR family transcriptional regulator|uniref:IclR family transcriptional regulator n=1 Tax=Microbacterium sp. SORGH_AS_0428 TaxID=3041788 RepID=UPI0028576372|nr:IclR family transcriptional regulator [Microbacterium sp. SORGH_AS_0428]MDR6199632.1 DNA-binding IclR family transcriptional regulator [Microbacterium sp. SORGH_AS_0428]
MSMTTSEPPPPPALASVDHALRLLLLLGDRPELRVTEAAARLGVAPSTAHRLLTTLAARGFVTQDRISKVYRVGPALIEIGVHSTSSIDLRAAGEPHLKVLSQRISETVNLLVRQGDSVRFVAGFEADQQVRTQVLTGALLPAYATSGGKVLLAELSREELRALYPRGLRRLTQRTRTFTQLMAELPLVMMRGFAVNDQESRDGLSAIAVPLRARDGRAIAAVAMSAPSARLGAERMRELVVELRACASAIRGDLAR